MLGLALATQALPQDVHRGRPFQNPSQSFNPAPVQHQQAHSQTIENGQYREQRNQYPEQNNNQYQETPASHITGDRRSTTTPIPILQWNKQQEHDGTYRAR